MGDRPMALIYPMPLCRSDNTMELLRHLHLSVSRPPTLLLALSFLPRIMTLPTFSARLEKIFEDVDQ